MPSAAQGPGTVIPVAGGKGGVGKSFLAANLAMALAGEGQRVVAADLDLGSPNLHGYLGLPNRYPGVGDFLAGDGGGLAERLVATAVPGLRFLPGAGRTPFLANLGDAQKRRLLRELREIPCDYLLLDLGAGTAFNTLDLALAADSGLFVTTPESAAIQSLLTFLRNLLLREARGLQSEVPGMREAVRRLSEQSAAGPVVTVPGVEAEMEAVSPAAAEALRSIRGRLRPRLLYNMGDTPADLDLLPSIDRTLSEVLGMQCDHIGFLPFDPLVRRAARGGEPFLLTHPDSPTAAALRRIAQRIIRFWGGPIPGSAELLRRHHADSPPDER
jgi:flagellar biosynthesis protein FlhG